MCLGEWLDSKRTSSSIKSGAQDFNILNHQSLVSVDIGSNLVWKVNRQIRSVNVSQKYSVHSYRICHYFSLSRPSLSFPRKSNRFFHSSPRSCYKRRTLLYFERRVGTWIYLQWSDPSIEYSQGATASQEHPFGFVLESHRFRWKIK